MIDLFWVSLVLLVVTIVVFIVRAVRRTNETIARASRSIPLERPEMARQAIERMRSLDVRCPRCGQPTSAILGSGSRYRCDDDACRHEIDGPDHFSTDAA